MQKYTDEEKLKLEERIWITKDVYKLLRKAKADYKKEKRTVSMSKIACNLLIEKYGDSLESTTRPRNRPQQREPTTEAQSTTEETQTPQTATDERLGGLQV